MYHYFHYFHYHRLEDVGFIKYLFETNMYNYFHYDHPVNDYFLYTAPNSIRPKTHASKV